MSCSLEQRRQWIQPAHPQLSVRAQCRLLGLARASLYYAARPESAENLQLMRLLDEEYTRQSLLRGAPDDLLAPSRWPSRGTQAGTPATALDGLIGGLGRYFPFYNEARPHQALGYRTPHAVYFDVA